MFPDNISHSKTATAPEKNSCLGEIIQKFTEDLVV